MRNHTKYGQNVAVIGLFVDYNELSKKYGWREHVNVEDFLKIEAVLMNTIGVSAVITVFDRSVLEFCGYISNDDQTDSINLGATLLVNLG